MHKFVGRVECQLQRVVTQIGYPRDSVLVPGVRTTRPLIGLLLSKNMANVQVLADLWCPTIPSGQWRVQECNAQMNSKVAHTTQLLSHIQIR